jgi:hypothetical protein
MQSSTQENKAKVRRLFEEDRRRSTTNVVDELPNPDFVCYEPISESGEVRGSASSASKAPRWWRSGQNTTYPE